MLPILLTSRRNAEYTNTFQLLFLLRLPQPSRPAKRTFAFSEIPHSFNDLGIELDSVGRGDKLLTKRFARFKSFFQLSTEFFQHAEFVIATVGPKAGAHRYRPWALGARYLVP